MESTWPFARILIRCAYMVFVSFKFARSCSFLKNEISGSDVTLRVILKVCCACTETEKEPIAVRFKRNCEILAEENRKFLRLHLISVFNYKETSK